MASSGGRGDSDDEAREEPLPGLQGALPHTHTLLSPPPGAGAPVPRAVVRRAKPSVMTSSSCWGGAAVFRLACSEINSWAPLRNGCFTLISRKKMRQN